MSFKNAKADEPAPRSSQEDGNIITTISGILERKIRNLEKRHAKCEMLSQMLESGERLNEDQKASALISKELENVLDILKEMNCAITSITNKENASAFAKSHNNRPMSPVIHSSNSLITENSHSKIDHSKNQTAKTLTMNEDSNPSIHGKMIKCLTNPQQGQISAFLEFVNKLKLLSFNSDELKKPENIQKICLTESEINNLLSLYNLVRNKENMDQSTKISRIESIYEKLFSKSSEIVGYPVEGTYAFVFEAYQKIDEDLKKIKIRRNIKLGEKNDVKPKQPNDHTQISLTPVNAIIEESQNISRVVPISVVNIENNAVSEVQETHRIHITDIHMANGDEIKEIEKIDKTQRAVADICSFMKSITIFSDKNDLPPLVDEKVEEPLKLSPRRGRPNRNNDRNRNRGYGRNFRGNRQNYNNQPVNTESGETPANSNVTPQNINNDSKIHEKRAEVPINPEERPRPVINESRNPNRRPNNRNYPNRGQHGRNIQNINNEPKEQQAAQNGAVYIKDENGYRPYTNKPPQNIVNRNSPPKSIKERLGGQNTRIEPGNSAQSATKASDNHNLNKNDSERFDQNGSRRNNYSRRTGQGYRERRNGARVENSNNATQTGYGRSRVSFVDNIDTSEKPRVSPISRNQRNEASKANVEPAQQPQIEVTSVPNGNNRPHLKVVIKDVGNTGAPETKKSLSTTKAVSAGNR